MIKKYSSNSFSELEFLFRKFAALPIEQASIEQIQAVITAIAEGGTLPAEVSQYAQDAAAKLSSSVPKLQQVIPDPKTQIPEIAQTIQQNPQLLQGITGGARTASETRKKLIKFSRKFNALKTEEEQVAFLKKTAGISEESLVKVGREVEERELIKRGYVSSGKGGVTRTKRMPTAAELSLVKTADGIGAGFAGAVGGVPAIDALKGEEIARSLLSRPQSWVQSGGNLAAARQTAAQYSSLEGSAAKAIERLSPGLRPVGGIDQVLGDVAGRNSLNVAKSGLPTTNQNLAKGFTTAVEEVAGGAGSRASGAVLREVGKDALQAAGESGGLWGRISGWAGSAAEGLGSVGGWIGKGLSWISSFFKFIPALYEFCMALYSIYKMIQAVGTITEQGTKIGITSWYEPILSYEPLTSKLNEVAGDLENIQTLGIVANACKSFWQNVVDATLSVVAGIVNWVLFATEALGTVLSGGAGFWAAIGVGFLTSYIINTVKSFLSSWIGGAMTSGYTTIVDQISQYLQQLIASKQTQQVQQVEQAPQAEYAPVEYAPREYAAREVAPAAAPDQEGAPARTRAPARPAAPAEVPLSRREERAQRRAARRQQRQERRALRREDRVARRAARRGVSAPTTATASKRLEQFIKLANELDNRDLVEEADLVDYLIYQLAR